MDDLVAVAVLDADLAERGSRHHLEVAFDSDAQRVEAELVHHLGDAHSPGYTPVLAVDPYREASIQTH